MSGVTQKMRDAEPFRWCVYCDVDCSVEDFEHLETCASVTGVYPVRKKDRGHECSACGHQDGMACGRCHRELMVGDSYMLVTLDEGDPLLPGLEGASVSEVVCVGCKFYDELEQA